jgi:hypothetical protein
MADVQTSKIDKKTCTSQRVTIKFCMLIDVQKINDFSEKNAKKKTKKKECGGRTEFKIHNLFYGDNP